MPNSGAFRSLHCLIYKVLARAAQRRNICYLITSDSVCQVLFSTFFKIFFRTQLSEPSVSQTACLFYQTFQSLSSTFFKFLENFFRPRRSPRLRLRQLADSSRFKSVCQTSFTRSPLTLVSELRSFAILPLAVLFVKPFFDFFQTFSALPPFCTPVPDSSVNIARPSFICQDLFLFFSNSFLPTVWGTPACTVSPATTPSLYTPPEFIHHKVHKIFSCEFSLEKFQKFSKF